MSWREHDGHAHGASAAGADADTRWLAAAGVLILAFMAGEVVAGLFARSLGAPVRRQALLPVAAAIELALATAKIAAPPPRGGPAFGLRRAEILQAPANGITLVLLAVWLPYEAVRRLWRRSR